MKCRYCHKELDPEEIMTTGKEYRDEETGETVVVLIPCHRDESIRAGYGWPRGRKHHGRSRRKAGRR